MATGTGNLPNQSMSFSPFAILTAEELNDLVENIESLADGSGIGDGAIDTTQLADESVTPDKRSGGYMAGFFTAPSTTGNYSVTGVGFKPKLVVFAVSYTSSDNDRLLISQGRMDEFGNQGYNAIYWTASLTRSRSSNGSAFVGYYSPGGSFTQELVGQYVSMDEDGFTVNIISTNTRYLVQWTAYA